MTQIQLSSIITNYIFETTPDRLNSLDDRSIYDRITQRPFSRSRRLRAIDILFYNIQYIIINSNLSIVHNYDQPTINSSLRHAAGNIWRRLSPQERNRYNQNTIRYRPYVVNNRNRNSSAIGLQSNSGLNLDDNNNNDNNILHEIIDGINFFG
ncbi:2384_t:CDS:1 [Diversispora eburnea]|uniref:2384_t:CDS:1 n=1 Tax=Diversispora eburnea TaxID=1213867 RepID=A0A9N9ASJ6_9GLOM|nr:2384_t:CDS:1 [Diversispora eburnea]